MIIIDTIFFFITKVENHDIDLFHNGDQIWYSFVLMLMSPISLAAMGRIQKNVSTEERPVGPININTKGIILSAAIYESGLCGLLVLSSNKAFLPPIFHQY